MSGPSRTSRPRTAWPSILKGWIRSSGTAVFDRAGRPAPAARRSLISDDAQAPGQDALLRMQAVLGLVPHRRLRAVDDAGGHLLAAMGRQAVHEYGVGLGHRHHPLVDAVAGEQVVMEVADGFVAHGDPDVRDDAVRLADGRGHVG